MLLVVTMTLCLVVIANALALFRQVRDGQDGAALISALLHVPLMGAIYLVLDMALPS
jgi:hypothetical protein